MSEQKKLNCRDYSKFDAMSTETLTELLRQDSLLPDEGSDPEAILYITKVIAERENREPTLSIPDAEAAWDSFNKNYRPTRADDTPIYEDDEAPSGAATPLSAASPARRKPRRLLRAVCVAAILAAVSVSAYALNFNIWGTVATWSKDIFGFEQAKQVPDELKELETYMVEDGLPSSMLPSYIPEGYVKTDCLADRDSDTFSDYYCDLEKEEIIISITYRVWHKQYSPTLYQKNEGPPEEYKRNGVTYYIMANYERYLAVWFHDDIECSITGVPSREELIKMIDSI